MRCDIEVNHLTSIMPQDHETVENSECCGRHGKEINGCQIGYMVFQKRSPSLRRWLSRAHHVLGNRSLGDRISQHRNFRLNPRCAPGQILARHASDQVSDFWFDSWPSPSTPSRLPPPVQPETLAVPTNHRIWLDDNQRGAPIAPQSGHPDPECAVASTQPSPFDGPIVYSHLLTKRRAVG